MEKLGSTEYAERYAEAEKTAHELLRWRPQFYSQLLENCSPSLPHGREEELKILIADAYKRVSAAKREKLL